MKTQSTVDIPVIQDLGTGRFYFHFNHHIIKHIGDENSETVNEADTVLLNEYPTEESIIVAIEINGYQITDIIIDQIKEALGINRE